MEKQYDNTNRGALFPNDKKGNEKAPDYKGDVYFGTEKKQIAGWIKEGKNGKKYMSLLISEPFKKSEPSGDTKLSQQGGEADEPMPF